jgi:hypothetical protein
MFIKRKLLLTTTLLLISAHISAWGDAVQTHRSTSNGFEVSYGNDWNASPSVSGANFFLRAKSEKEPATISFRVRKFSGNKETFINYLKNQQEKTLASIRSRFPNARMIADGDTYLGSHSAYFFKSAYTIKNLNYQLDVTQLGITCIKGERLYYVHFETPTALFNNTYNKFLAVMATFNFL